MVTVAVRPAASGIAELVPAGAVADDAIVFDGDRLVLVPLDGVRTRVENLGSMPLADVAIAPDVVVLASGAAARAAFEAAIDDFLMLSAAALVGIGARALEIGVEYVKERKAWGVPIGSFQSVAHHLADAAAALDGARVCSRTSRRGRSRPIRIGPVSSRRWRSRSRTRRRATRPTGRCTTTAATAS